MAIPTELSLYLPEFWWNICKLWVRITDVSVGIRTAYHSTEHPPAEDVWLSEEKWRFEYLTAVTAEIVLRWNVTQYSLVEAFLCFRGICCLRRHAAYSAYTQWHIPSQKTVNIHVMCSCYFIHRPRTGKYQNRFALLTPGSHIVYQSTRYCSTEHFLSLTDGTEIQFFVSFQSCMFLVTSSHPPVRGNGSLWLMRSRCLWTVT